jgi:hypothetical protein
MVYGIKHVSDFNESDGEKSEPTSVLDMQFRTRVYFGGRTEAQRERFLRGDSGAVKAGSDGE